MRIQLGGWALFLGSPRHEKPRAVHPSLLGARKSAPAASSSSTHCDCMHRGGEHACARGGGSSCMHSRQGATGGRWAGGGGIFVGACAVSVLCVRVRARARARACGLLSAVGMGSCVDSTPCGGVERWLDKGSRLPSRGLVMATPSSRECGAADGDPVAVPRRSRGCHMEATWQLCAGSPRHGPPASP